MVFLAQLQSQHDSYERIAWSVGLSRPVGKIRASVARDFAEKLRDCSEVAKAKTEMFQDQAGAQAFWIYSEAVIDETKSGSISTLSDNPPASVFVELLASTVFLFCQNLIKKNECDVLLDVA